MPLDGPIHPPLAVPHVAHWAASPLGRRKPVSGDLFKALRRQCATKFAFPHGRRTPTDSTDGRCRSDRRFRCGGADTVRATPRTVRWPTRRGHIAASMRRHARHELRSARLYFPGDSHNDDDVATAVKPELMSSWVSTRSSRSSRSFDVDSNDQLRQLLSGLPLFPYLGNRGHATRGCAFAT